ncbi:DUF3040 domain-containing protein [Pseudonocardia spirodelae]|uniref:DUF3040 domain-containing protein n=1 Tax=Pseudonocardia spirodelae TaxID=3133431 RepID=A0ABU8T7G5_9PSEU
MSVTPPPLPPPPDGGTGDPEPRPSARPLDREEERVLSGLEDELRRSDPDLRLSPPDPAPRAAPGGSADRILQGVAIGVIALVLVPSDWLAGLLSFGLLLGIPVAMAWIAFRARREQATAGPDGDAEPRP